MENLQQLSCQIDVRETAGTPATAKPPAKARPCDWSNKTYDDALNDKLAQLPGCWTRLRSALSAERRALQAEREEEAMHLDWNADPRGRISNKPTVFDLARRLGCLDELVDAGVAQLQAAYSPGAGFIFGASPEFNTTMQKFMSDACLVGAEHGCDPATMALGVHHLLWSTSMDALAALWHKEGGDTSFAKVVSEAELRAVLLQRFSVTHVWSAAPHTAVFEHGCIPAPLDDPDDAENGWSSKFTAHLAWLHSQFLCRGLNTYARLQTAIRSPYVGGQPVPSSSYTRGHADYLKPEFVAHVMNTWLAGAAMKSAELPEETKLRIANFYFNHHCTFDPRAYTSTLAYSTLEKDYDGWRGGQYTFSMQRPPEWCCSPGVHSVCPEVSMHILRIPWLAVRLDMRPASVLV